MFPFRSRRSVLIDWAVLKIKLGDNIHFQRTRICSVYHVYRVMLTKCSIDLKKINKIMYFATKIEKKKQILKLLSIWTEIRKLLFHQTFKFGIYIYG